MKYCAVFVLNVYIGAVGRLSFYLQSDVYYCCAIKLNIYIYMNTGQNPLGCVVHG